MSSSRASVTWWLPLLVVLAGAGSARGNVYTYDNTTSGTIPNASNDTNCNNNNLSLLRTFSVAETFNVQTVAVGLTIDHNRRGDVRARLIAPNGTAILLFDNSGDTDDDYDILLSTNTDTTGAPSTTALDDADDDDSDVGVGTSAAPAAPFFHRLVTLAGLDTFYNGSAAGTWTLQMCDRETGSVTGTFQRARLVLTDSATTVPQVCTSTIDYEWGDNGDNTGFTSATFGGVTLTETSTTDTTGDGSAQVFTTQTETFGAQPGYYIIEFDAEAGPPDDIERTNFVATFSLSPAVHAFAWTMLDIDTGNWEDYVRLTGFNASGDRLPFSISPGTSHERAGDLLEADSGNIADTSSAGNATWVWDGAVASIQVEYWAGDELANPGSQRIGIGNPLLCAFDYGDAPDSYGTSLSGGARHVLGDRDVYLGTIAPDGEADGQPGAAGTLDDTNTVGGVDDEDGIGPFPTYVPPSTSYTVSVTASNFSGVDAFIVAYIDWNRDGDFDDPNEVSAPVTVPTGSNGASFNVTWSSVPVGAGGTSSTYSRFRISTDLTSVQSPAGQAPDGEVEDHVVPINTLPVTLAWVETARERGALAVRFMTATESRNAGFRIWGLDGRSLRTLLGEIPATGVDSFVPQSYEARYDAPEGVVAIEIEDLALDNGRARRHGLFTVGATAGRRPEAAAIDWQATHAELAFAAQETAARRAAERATPAALLKVREAGVHRVTYEQLRDAGLDLAGVPGSRLGLTDAGRAVPRFASTEGAFGPGAYLEFVAKPQLTLASPFDVYVLKIDRRATANPGAIGAGAGAPAIVRAEAVHRPQVAYSPGAPNGDPWYDARLLAFGSPVQVTRTFDLPDLAGGAVRLTVEGWGYSYFDGAAPDHHVVVRVNGNEVADETFDGLATYRRTIDVSGLVTGAGNTLEFVLPGDTGFTFDLVHFDGFTVEYPRSAVAQDGRFHGRRADAKAAAYAVDGLADGPVSIWLDRAGRWTRGEATAVGGRASVPDGSADAWLADAGGALAPEIVAGVPSPLQLTTAQVAVVTHPVFAGTAGLDDLVALQRARGFTVEVATVDRIFAAYGDHAPSAEAIRRFVAESRAHGALRYVVLVGADTSDPYDHLGLGSVSFVPTAYLPVVPDVSFSPTDEALVDVDGDGLPDVPVGRLPVRTSAELADAVAKLWAWEQNVSGPPQALFVAGASDAESSLGPINAAYGAALGGSAAFAEVDEIGLAAARSATLAAMNDGVPLVSFVGHSSPGQWDFDPILRWQDVASFTNVGEPNLVTQWGCWNSYYVEPAIESMSGRLLRTPGVGAAGTLGASTLTSDASHRRLGVLFFQQVGQGAPRLGDAFLAAKRALAAEGGALDAVLGMALLGDPAMPLPAAAGRR